MPGLNEWAQNMEDEQNHLQHLDQQPNSSKRLNLSTAQLKRSYDDSDEDPDAMDTDKNGGV